MQFKILVYSLLVPKWHLKTLAHHLDCLHSEHYVFQTLSLIQYKFFKHTVNSNTYCIYTKHLCRCPTTDSLPRGYPGQYVRASAYAELDG